MIHFTEEPWPVLDPELVDRVGDTLREHGEEIVTWALAAAEEDHLSPDEDAQLALQSLKGRIAENRLRIRAAASN